jgi:hypothetical protein
MNINMTESLPLATTGELGAGVVYTLKFAVIAGAILACSESSSPASSQELPPAPEIEQVTGEKAARFKEFLSNQGYEGIQFVALAYGESEQETLIVLLFPEEEEKIINGSVDEIQSQIPLVGTNFDEAVVLYTGSPGNAATCGSASGGNRSCTRTCRPLGGDIYC